MSRFELYSPEGLRVDGRRFNELRHFKCTLGTHAKAADGSARVEMGASHVVCTVEGPQQPTSRSKMDISKATLTVNLVIAPFSTTERQKHGTNERPLQEISINLRETFETAVITHFAPRTEVVVNIHVLAQDGDLMPACVNAMCLALVDAGVPMLEYVAAVGVALCNEVPMLDPNHIEAQELPTVTVGVVGKTNRVSLLLLEKRMIMDCLEPVVDLGIEGCKVVRDIMDQEVRRKLANV